MEDREHYGPRDQSIGLDTLPLLVERDLLARIGNLEQLLGRELVDDLCDLFGVDLSATLALDAVIHDELTDIGLGEGGTLNRADGSAHEVVTAVLALLERLDTDLELEKSNLTCHFETFR